MVSDVCPVTEKLVLAFLDLLAERSVAGKKEVGATMETLALWLTERTGLSILQSHIPPLVHTLAEARIIVIGGHGIGKPNYYVSRESEMGVEAFWNQVDALLMVWQHPSRKQLGNSL